MRINKTATAKIVRKVCEQIASLQWACEGKFQSTRAFQRPRVLQAPEVGRPSLRISIPHVKGLVGGVFAAFSSSSLARQQWSTQPQGKQPWPWLIPSPVYPLLQPVNILAPHIQSQQRKLAQLLSEGSSTKPTAVSSNGSMRCQNDHVTPLTRGGLFKGLRSSQSCRGYTAHGFSKDRRRTSCTAHPKGSFQRCSSSP